MDADRKHIIIIGGLILPVLNANVILNESNTRATDAGGVDCG